MTKAIPRDAQEVTFGVPLKKGVTELAPLFIGGGVEATPHFAYVTHRIVPGWKTAQGMGIPTYDPEYGRRSPQVTQPAPSPGGKKKKTRRKVSR